MDVSFAHSSCPRFVFLCFCRIVFFVSLRVESYFVFSLQNFCLFFPLLSLSSFPPGCLPCSDTSLLCAAIDAIVVVPSMDFGHIAQMCNVHRDTSWFKLVRWFAKGAPLKRSCSDRRQLRNSSIHSYTPTTHVHTNGGGQQSWNKWWSNEEQRMEGRSEGLNNQVESKCKLLCWLLGSMNKGQ